ncbi:MAG: TRAP transporter small permease subunit [Myxococcales bacterium]|nr:TRAP transporter small permease subunit [Myxococcales bacterium]
MRDRFERFIGAMNAVGTLWIFVLMLLINADVIGREVFGTPVRGVTEMVSLSIVAIVFLQMAHTLWVGRLTRNDALLRRLARSSPQLHALLEGAAAVAGAGLFALLAFASVPYVGKALRVREYVGALGDFTLPTWPVRALIVAGSLAVCIAFLAAPRGRRPGSSL